MISGLLFYFLLLLRSAQVLGRIISTVATDNCTQSKALGGSVSCCTGTCSDGTIIGEPGLCMDWNTPCTDEVGATCPSGQVMKYGPSSSFVDSGDGDCYGDGFCQWQQTLWRWSCCDCPPGYTSVSDGECGTDAGSFVCLACSDPAETLTDDGTGWVCTVTKGISCDIVRIPTFHSDGRLADLCQRLTIWWINLTLFLPMHQRQPGITDMFSI